MLSDTKYGRLETVDHELVEYAYENGRLKFVEDSAQFMWTELTSRNTYNPTLRNAYWTNSSRFLARTPITLRG